MTYFTRNILDFYEYKNTNIWFLENMFTNIDNLGYYQPYAKNPVDSKWDGKAPYIGTIDEINTYNINGLGFRGEEYKNPEIIASGCSITFGLGIPESSRWTNLLGNKINKEVMNMGNPGASVETICNHIIQYCSNNSMPKEIFCLFPDFFRSMVVADKEFYRTRKNTWAEKKDYLQLVFCNPTISFYGNDSFSMEIKDKEYIEDAVSPHQLILNSVNAIYTLESFCLSNNIKLHWTTWDVPTSVIMESLVKLKNFKLKNFTPFFPPETKKGIGTFIDNSCKLDHESEFRYNSSWVQGSDYSIVDSKKVTNTAHPGIHVHTHIAEFFHNLHNKI